MYRPSIRGEVNTADLDWVYIAIGYTPNTVVFEPTQLLDQSCTYYSRIHGCYLTPVLRYDANSDQYYRIDVRVTRVYAKVYNSEVK